MKRPSALILTLLVGAAACGDGAATMEPAAINTTAASTTTIVRLTETTDVTFTTADGLTLEGRAFRAGDTWVVLGHMFPSDMTSWFDFAGALNAAGYSALAYNNRGYGNSDVGADLDVGADALAAIAFVRTLGATEIFYIGASMNGAAALFVGAEEDLAGIATISGVSEWNNTPGLSRAGEIIEPGLFVAGRYEATAADAAQSFADAVAGEAQVIIYPTINHGTLIFNPHPELTDALIAFVVENSS